MAKMEHYSEYSAAVDGNTAVVGAYEDDTAGSLIYTNVSGDNGRKFKSCTSAAQLPAASAGLSILAAII